MTTVAQFLQQGRDAANQQGAQVAWQEAVNIVRATYEDIYTQLGKKRSLFARKLEAYPLDWDNFLGQKEVSGFGPEVQSQLTEYLSRFIAFLKDPDVYQKRWAQVSAMLVTLSVFLIKNAATPNGPPDAQAIAARQSVAAVQSQIQTQVQQLEYLKSLGQALAQQRDHWASVAQNQDLLALVRRKLIEAEDDLLLQFQLFPENSGDEPPSDQAINAAVRTIDLRLYDLMGSVGGLARIEIRVGMPYDATLMEVVGMVPNQGSEQTGTVAEMVGWGYVVRPNPQATNVEPMVQRRAKVRLFGKVGA